MEAVAVLTTKYAFPRVPHPDWADRETTEESVLGRQIDLPLQEISGAWREGLERAL